MSLDKMTTEELVRQSKEFSQHIQEFERHLLEIAKVLEQRARWEKELEGRG